MSKTEQSLARIFAICDEVAEGKREPRTEVEGAEMARQFLGLKTTLTQADCIFKKEHF